MFCLFDMIYVCGINELENLNLNKISSIINCSIQLNNCFTNHNITNLNIINANLNKPINFMIQDIIQILNYIYDCCSLGKKIILVDENGIDNSMFITIMFLMKYHKKKFDEIYSSIILYTNLHPKEYYSSINLIEYYLINNFLNPKNNLIQQNTFQV